MNQLKIEQIILDSLSHEFELMKTIHNFLNKSKNLLSESNKKDLIDLMNVQNDEKFSIKKELWLKSIDDQSFFCAQIAKLKKNFLVHLSLESNSVHFFEHIIDKYFNLYSLKSTNYDYISLYYFDQIFDIFDHIVQIVKCEKNLNIFQLIMDHILAQENQNKIYFSQFLFSQLLIDLHKQDPNITSSLSNFQSNFQIF